MCEVNAKLSHGIRSIKASEMIKIKVYNVEDVIYCQSYEALCIGETIQKASISVCIQVDSTTVTAVMASCYLRSRNPARIGRWSIHRATPSATRDVVTPVTSTAVGIIRALAVKVFAANAILCALSRAALEKRRAWRTRRLVFAIATLAIRAHQASAAVERADTFLALDTRAAASLAKAVETIDTVAGFFALSNALAGTKVTEKLVVALEI